MMLKSDGALLSLCLAALLMSGCSRTDMAHSKNWVEGQLGLAPENAEVKDAGPQPEVWCYRTIGKPDCYNKPLPDAETRLISVDPPSKIPSTPEAYRKMQADPVAPAQ